MTIRGVDVASYQGGPGQWETAAGTITWAAVKFTELSGDGGEYVDPDAAADWAALKTKGHGRVAYLYAHPAASAAETVSFFLGHVRAAGFDAGDMIAVDSETTDGRSAADVAEWGLEVLKALKEQTGRTPVEYMDRSWAASGCAAGHHEVAALWIADPDAEAGHPQVPAGWPGWAIHQYSISGQIDQDVANYADLAAMRAALGQPAAPPPPKHAAPPTGDPMQFVSSVTLAATTTVLAGKTSVLKWKKGPAGDLLTSTGEQVKLTGAAVMLSLVTLYLAAPAQVRFELVPLDADGKPGTATAKNHPDGGGYVDFIGLFDGAADASYQVQVVNWGSLPAKISAGTWQLVS